MFLVIGGKGNCWNVVKGGADNIIAKGVTFAEACRIVKYGLAFALHTTI